MQLLLGPQVLYPFLAFLRWASHLAHGGLRLLNDEELSYYRRHSLGTAMILVPHAMWAGLHLRIPTTS